MRMPTTSRSQMQGQALVELAVAAVVLVPLFLLIPIVAKYSHIKQMAQQAARNAAWEASVSASHALPARLDAERRALDRTFAAADAPIRSDVGSVAGRGAFDDQMLNTFSGRKLLERDDLHVPSLTQADSPGYVDEALVPIELATAATGKFKLNKQGYVTANIRLNARDLKTADGAPARYLAPFDNLGIGLDRRQSLLVDAWNASGPRARGDDRSVVETVRPLVPTTKLAGLDKLLTLFKPPLDKLPVVGALGGLKLGTIEPDVVPADKLAQYPVRKQP